MTTASWKVLASHNALDHRWYIVRRDTLQLPDGTIVDDFFVSVRPDVVVDVAVDRSGQMVLVRQYPAGRSRENARICRRDVHGRATRSRRPAGTGGRDRIRPGKDRILGPLLRQREQIPYTFSWHLIANRAASKAWNAWKRPRAWKCCSCRLPRSPRHSTMVTLPRCRRSRPVIVRCEDSLAR